jgi:hypothetical protein
MQGDLERRKSELGRVIGSNLQETEEEQARPEGE